MNISGTTKITGLFGYPVEHTLSPAMHNSAFRELGLDYCYIPFLVHPDALGRAVDSIRALSMAGVNVTVPHKEHVIRFLDAVDPEARFIGAVNTIVHRDGKLTGYNTDGRGFMRSLAEQGVSPDGRKVFVLGAGGASRAISYYLSEKAELLAIFDTDGPKLRKLVDDLASIRPNVSALGSVPELSCYDIVINATPLGLKEGDPLPLPVSSLSELQVVCDLIYRQTPLLEAASRKGCLTIHGLGMLLWQGVLAFELWTGKMPPVEVMRSALQSAIGSH